MWPLRNVLPAASYLLAVAIRRGNSCGCPTIQPSFAGLERGIAFLCARVVDAVSVEGSLLPFLRCDLVHADVGAELVRQLGELAVTFLQAIVAPLFGSTLINADAAPAHLMHHRQQIDFQPVGVARAFLIEDWIQVFKQPQRGDRIALGVGSDEVRRQLIDVLGELIFLCFVATRRP